VLSDAGMNYHTLIANNGADLTISEVEGAVDLVISDSGMNYHTVRVNDGADLVLVHDHYLVPSDAGMNYHLVRVDNGVDLTLVHDHYLVMSDAGMNYHTVRVDDGVDLTLTEVIDLVITDAGMNYHSITAPDPLWWIQNTYHDLVDVPPYAFSVLGAYHDHVVNPTNLTLVQVGAIDLVMSDGGMNYHTVRVNDGADLVLVHDHYLVPSDAGMNYHDLVANGGVDLALVHDHYLVMSDAGMNYHELEANGGVDLALVHDHYVVISDAGMNYHVLEDSGPLPATQVYPDDCYHDNVVNPTDLTIEEIGDVTLANLNAFHVTDSPELPATQVYPDSLYHDHIVDPSDLTLVEVKDLTIAPDPYHDLITKDEVWFVQQAVHELVSIPDNLTLGITHILAVDACFHEIEDGAPFALVQILTLVLSDAGVNYHDHVVTPTDLTISELGPVDLLNLDAAHIHTAPNLTITHVSSVVIDVADAIRTLVDLTTNRTLHLL
jgi:hypothetical protein